MKIDTWLAESTNKLAEKDIKTARLDCLVLLQTVTYHNTAWILAHLTDDLSKFQLRRLNKYIVQRIDGKPISYITSTTYFYNHKFMVNEHVLVPRPESESMISILNKLSDITNIIDVGTGSGALAISANLLLPNTHVIGVDIDRNCLKVARQNAKQLSSSVKFLQSDLLSKVSPAILKKSVILANLPYVPENYKINKSAEFEPKIAIFGGKSGLDLYHKLVAQIDKLNDRPTFILTESLVFQHQDIISMFQNINYRLEEVDNLVLLFSYPH